MRVLRRGLRSPPRVLARCPPSSSPARPPGITLSVPGAAESLAERIGSGWAIVTPWPFPHVQGDRPVTKSSCQMGVRAGPGPAPRVLPSQSGRINGVILGIFMDSLFTSTLWGQAPFRSGNWPEDAEPVAALGSEPGRPGPGPVGFRGAWSCRAVGLQRARKRSPCETERQDLPLLGAHRRLDPPASPRPPGPPPPRPLGRRDPPTSPRAVLRFPGENRARLLSHGPKCWDRPQNEALSSDLGDFVLVFNFYFSASNYWCRWRLFGCVVWGAGLLPSAGRHVLNQERSGSECRGACACPAVGGIGGRGKARGGGPSTTAARLPVSQTCHRSAGPRSQGLWRGRPGHPLVPNPGLTLRIRRWTGQLPR